MYVLQIREYCMYKKYIINNGAIKNTIIIYVYIILSVASSGEK
jgi:hypothetical protein